MPNYSAHTATNIFIGVPLIYYGFREQTLIERDLVVTMSLTFLIATFFLSPDLDLKHSIPTKNWGIFRFIWMGYHKLFRHRGSSHNLLFSSFTKLIYLAITVGLVLFATSFFYKLVIGTKPGPAFWAAKKLVIVYFKDWMRLLIEHKRSVLGVIGGIVLSDWVHICTDRLHSAAKRLKLS